MQVNRTDGSETMEPLISINDGKKMKDGITSVKIGLHDLNKLTDLSPTQLMATMLKVKSHFYNPMKGKL